MLCLYPGVWSSIQINQLRLRLDSGVSDFMCLRLRLDSDSSKRPQGQSYFGMRRESQNFPTSTCSHNQPWSKFQAELKSFNLNLFMAGYKEEDTRKFTAVVVNKYQLRIAEDRSGDKVKYRKKFERRVSSILKEKLP